MHANAKEEILDLLDKHGFELQRDRKHLVYRQPSTGKVFTMSKTPSDFRAYPNALRDLKRILGVGRPVPVVGERREKKAKTEPFRKIDFAVENRVGKLSFQDQLTRVREQLTFEIADSTGLGKTITGRTPSAPVMQVVDPPWEANLLMVTVSSTAFGQISRAVAERRVIFFLEEGSGLRHVLKPWTVEDE